jgi:hypothetical protein
MNRKTYQLSLLFLVAVVMLTSLLASPVAADGNPSAAGHGNLISFGELRTFSFTSVQHADGTVTGEGEVFNRGLGTLAHWKIDCLKFEGENRVIASGLITQSSDPFLVGRIFVFGAEDNGEGNNASTDRITTMPDYAPPKSCNEFTFVGNTLRDVNDLSVVVRTLNPILAGNIQVQP